jgi:hypothetical protein
VFLAIRSPLLDGSLTLDEARASGHTLAVELAGLAVAGGAAGAFARSLPRRALPLAWIATMAAAAVGAGAIVLAGPVDLAERVADSFRGEPPATSENPSKRLLSSSSSERAEYWRVAAHMVRRQPVLGEGAGSYERWWLQERPVANGARNAHNLFLETLAELGPVGLALLVVGLGIPIVARASREPLASAALAAYAAWVAHALLDWDWQIPAVTLVGLACGISALVLGREWTPALPLTNVRRGIGAAVVLPVLVAALVMHVGNRAADAGQTALDDGRATDAAADARRARTWMPWAAEPWRLLGEAESAMRQAGRARESLHRAAERNPDDWTTWYDIASVSRGSARARALQRARRLNPLEPALERG